MNRSMSSLILIYILCISTVSSTLPQKRIKRIFKGSFCYIDNYSFYAVVFSNLSESSLICGSSIVHVNWAITSKNCCKKNPKFIKIAAQTRKHLSYHSYYSIISIHNEINSVCLLRIRLPKNIINKIQPIEIMDLSNRQIEDCVIGFSIGFGRTKPSKSKLAELNNELICTKISLLFGNDCMFEEESKNNDKFCSIEGNNTHGFPCYGDEGGPIICDNELIGIIESIKCNPKSKMSVLYTKIKNPYMLTGEYISSCCSSEALTIIYILTLLELFIL